MTLLDNADPIAPPDLTALFDRQRRAFLEEGPPSADVRRRRLDRLLLAVLGVAEELADALDADFGHRPRAFNLTADVVPIVENVRHLSANLERWMAPVAVPGSDTAGIPTMIEVAPLGVVGVVGPWNFPVGLVLQPAAEAIAAGNRVMIKFSDVHVRTGAVLARAIGEEFDPGELIVVNGGLDIATRFSSLPFDHLFFTGSPAVGKVVQRAAADNLTPVTLELGGKNPAVVDVDTDLTFAADRIAASRIVNGGQVCLCPDYAFVPRTDIDAFVAELRSAFQRVLPDVATNPGHTAIVNNRNFDRVSRLLDDAVAKGATAVVCASAVDAAQLPDPVTRRIAPTVLLGVTDEMTVAKEEVFGPLLAVFPYDDIAEVISYVAARPSPLVAYWYGEDSDAFTSFRNRTSSGGVTRNDFAVHALLPDVPFGGVGHSGTGSYHGKAGFVTFSHQRAVAESRLPNGLVGRLSPAALGDDTAQVLLAHLAQSHGEALARLGR